MNPLNPINPAVSLVLEHTLEGTLGVEPIELTADRVVARLPVSDRIRQPYGAVHGGAIMAMAEGLASMGTLRGIDYPAEVCFGQEINGSLLRTVFDGHIEATATVLHRGRTTWVWDVRALDSEGQLVAVVRCSIAVRPNRKHVPDQP